MELRVARYQPDVVDAWNAWVSKARNGTFLFDRGYMDYHRDRFVDHSVLVYRGSGVVAAMPANQVGSSDIVSHGGLTYGGLLIDDEATLAVATEACRAVVEYYGSRGFVQLTYRRPQAVFCRTPADEDETIFHHLGATLAARKTLHVFDRQASVVADSRRRRGLKKAQKAGLSWTRSVDFDGFWREILVPTLNERHGASPVHTSQEITRLHAAFPDAIRLYEVIEGGRRVAGVVIYLVHDCAHAQYIATTPRGAEVGALDLLMHGLMHEEFAAKRYFSFGTSNDPETGEVNQPLAAWKEGFGARARSLDTYALKLGKR